MEWGTAVRAIGALKLKHAEDRDAVWWVMTVFRNVFRLVTKPVDE